MKLIMRADDLGFSEGVNYGIYKSVVDGVITSVGMMPNMASAKHGYELVKDLDIALGQHSNICSSKVIRARQVDTINVAECEIELEAQLAKFRAITGRDPDYFEGHAVFSNNFFIALKNVAQRNNLFFENPSLDKEWEKEFGITGLGFMSLDEHGLYDPRTYMEEHLDIIKNNPCAVAIFHPGFLDQYILEHSSFTLIRPMECDFLCSDWLSEWLNKNKIELVNFKNYK